MKVYTVSDIHVDYPENMQWVKQLDKVAYRNDILILAGDVSDKLSSLHSVFDSLRETFLEVLFVPGNHELWINRDDFSCSLEKFEAVQTLAQECGVKTGVFEYESISFVPLFSWYDFSFGEVDRRLRLAWRDFRSCKWPAELADSAAVSKHFLARNEENLNVSNNMVISFSHFLPRIDVMPVRIPMSKRNIYPVLGSSELGAQLERLKPDIHIYGHSHVNQSIELDGIQFINNAFAYPSETRISRKRLHCVYDSKSRRSAVAANF